MIEFEHSEGVCVLRLNAPPLNTFGFAELDELVAAIRRAEALDAVQGIVITGSPEHFSAGGDIGMFEKIETAEDAIRISRTFQETCAVVENCRKPVLAAVAGQVMGGALELAMACHFRVCAEGTRFSMPEVNLGINPGAGGTQRLPRLIGTDAALDMLLTARPIDAQRAFDLDLVDAVAQKDALLEIARTMLSVSTEPIRASELIEKTADPEALQAAFDQAEKKIARGRPELIAPAKILEAMKIGLTESFEAGLQAERDVFAQCMETPATRNLIYLFFATRKTGKFPVEPDQPKPAPVASTAVVGMGSMGAGIVHAMIIAGFPVVVLDERESALEKGVAKIRKSLEKRAQAGKLDPKRAEAMLALISTTTSWEDLAKADLVIEAAFEDAEIKRNIIARIEEVCSEETLIATNTSTLSLDLLARDMARPERFVGMHFFNPAQRMPLVEVIRRDSTSGATVARALRFAKALRKTPVLVRNREGFLVNRLFIPYLKEAFALLEEGAEARSIDAAMVQFGFPMGPLALIDMSGIDILLFTDKVMQKTFPNYGPRSKIVDRLVDADRLGQKTGAGVYRYEKGDYTAHTSETTAALVAEVRQGSGLSAREIGNEEITQRLVLRMVAEALHVLQEGLVQRESDIDAAMALGVGFPAFRGGVLKYARDMGVDTITTQLKELTERHGPRFSPPSDVR